MAAQLTAEEVGKMTVAQLRTELGNREIAVGKAKLKKQLADLLLDHLAPSSDAPAPQDADTTAAGALETDAVMESADTEIDPVAPQQNGESQVVHPLKDSLDPVPGVVFETSDKKRKLEQHEPDHAPHHPPVDPPSVQESEQAIDNPPVPSPPQAKKPRLEEPASLSIKGSAAHSLQSPVQHKEANGNDAHTPPKQDQTEHRQRSPEPRPSSPDLRKEAPAPPPKNQFTSSTPDTPASEAIYITNLARPFTMPQLRGKLREYGDLDNVWLDSIKSHAYATYKDIDSATDAKNALHGQVWPIGTGKELAAIHIPLQRVPAFIKEEESAGKRLELVARFLNADAALNDSGEWIYELVPFGTDPAALSKPVKAPAVRGLAHSASTSSIHIPSAPSSKTQDRPAMLSAGISPTGPKWASVPKEAPKPREVAKPRDSPIDRVPPVPAIFAPRKQKSPEPQPPAPRPRSPSAEKEAPPKIYLPPKELEHTFYKTKAEPNIYFREVDEKEAERRLEAGIKSARGPTSAAAFRDGRGGFAPRGRGAWRGR